MSTYLVDSYNSTGSSSNLEYIEASNQFNFITTGELAGGEYGTYMKGRPTREFIFDAKFIVNQHDLQNSNEYIILWKMDSPEGGDLDYDVQVDNANYTGRRCEGYGISASIELRLISSALHLCLVNHTPFNSSTIEVSTPINLSTEYYVRIFFDPASSTVADPSFADPENSLGRLNAQGSLVDTNTGIAIGWNGAWRHIPFWGCILHPDVAGRGETNSVSLKDVQVGRTFTNQYVDPEVSEQLFLDVRLNPERIITS